MPQMTNCRPAGRKLQDLPGPPAAPPRAISEHVAQAQLVARIRLFLPGVLAFAIPNGGGRTSWEGSRLKAEGVLAGVPDLLVAEPKPPHAGLFLEVKRARGGRLSRAQADVGRILREKGYAVAVGRGLEDAWSQVKAYLDDRAHPARASWGPGGALGTGWGPVSDDLLS